jgi:hypothetical protein
MKNPTLISKKNYLRAALMLPVACLLAFTGCSNVQGTSGNHTTTTNRVATYLEQSQEQTNNNPVDQDPDPGYEWFY